MKKEIERLEREYNIEITLQMEKSDALDNRSARCYRVYARINNNLICEYGFCKQWKNIIENFENKLLKEEN